MEREKKNSKRTIVITGVPGTGKTAIAAELSRLLGAKTIALNDLVISRGLYESIDISDGAKVALLPKLQAALKEEIAAGKTGVIVEGHLACEIKFRAYAVFVLRCHPDELKKRLASRNYSQAKLKSNVLSEMLDYCTLMCERNFPPGSIFEIDTSGKRASDCAREMAVALKDKKMAKKHQRKTDWSSLLFSQEVDFRNL